jgi:hypothetical protein
MLRDAADKARQELRETLGRPVLDHVEVRFGRDVREMESLAPRGARLPSYASGVAFPSLDLVLLTATPRYPGEQLDLVQVFKHELAHVALNDAVAGQDVPRWFNEGYAVHASGEAYAARAQTLWTATLAKTLLPLRDLTQRFPADPTSASIAYAEASDLVRFLLRADEGPRFRALIERVASGQSFDHALADAYSTDVASLENEWREEVARRYSFWPILFGGTTLWTVAMALFFWGYVKRKRRARSKLERWGREEAAEDLRRAILATNLGQAGALRLVFAPAVPDEPSEAEGSTGQRGDQDGILRPVAGSHASSSGPAGTSAEGHPLTGMPGVPRVQHDGGWHTLH